MLSTVVTTVGLDAEIGGAYLLHPPGAVWKQTCGKDFLVQLNRIMKILSRN